MIYIEKFVSLLVFILNQDISSQQYFFFKKGFFYNYFFEHDFFSILCISEIILQKINHLTATKKLYFDKRIYYFFQISFLYILFDHATDVFTNHLLKNN